MSAHVSVAKRLCVKFSIRNLTAKSINWRSQQDCIKEEDNEDISDLPWSSLQKIHNLYKRKNNESWFFLKVSEFFAGVSPPHLHDVVQKIDFKFSTYFRHSNNYSYIWFHTRFFNNSSCSDRNTAVYCMEFSAGIFNRKAYVILPPDRSLMTIE